MTSEQACRCGAPVLRAASGRVVCATVECPDPVPTSPAKIDREAFAKWNPGVAGEQDDDDGGRWWT